jgi:hypothetical protein
MTPAGAAVCLHTAIKPLQRAGRAQGGAKKPPPTRDLPPQSSFSSFGSGK